MKFIILLLISLVITCSLKKMNIKENEHKSKKYYVLSFTDDNGKFVWKDTIPEYIVEDWRKHCDTTFILDKCERKYMFGVVIKQFCHIKDSLYLKVD